MERIIHPGGEEAMRSNSPSGERHRFIHRTLTQARQNNGGLLVIDGAPGMGKTFMLRALVEAAASGGECRTIFVRADEIEETEPYSFIERLAASSSVADWSFEPTAQTNPIDIARECVQRLTTMGNPGHLLVAFDDAQWIDDASQRVLRYVIPRVIRRGVLLAFGVRTPMAPSGFGEFLTHLCKDNPLDGVKHLEPLSAADISAVVRERYGTRISSQSAERLLAATDGVFLALDSILTALEDKDLSRSHLEWETEIPIGAESSSPLLHVFRQLAPTVQRTCEIASLAGHELSSRDLGRTAAKLGESLDLEAALDSGVLIETGVERAIMPRHALLGEAIAATVSPDRAREVFRALAATTSGHRSMRHTIRGFDRWDEDLSMQIQSYVDAEAAAGRLRNASEALREALLRAEDPEARELIIIDLVLIHMEAKTSYLVLDLLEELETLPRTPLTESLCIVLAAHRGEQYFPLERVQRVLSTPPADLNDLVVLSHLAFMMVILAMRSPKSADLPQAIELAKAFATQLPTDPSAVTHPRLRWAVDPVGELVVLDAYALVAAQWKCDTDSIKLLLPSVLERALALPDGPNKVDALVALAGVEVSIGEVVTARSLAQQAVDMLGRVGLPWAAGTARLIVADCRVMLGEFQSARTYIDMVEELAYETMDVEARTGFAAIRAIIAAVTNSGDWNSHAQLARKQRVFTWEGYEPALTLLADCEIARMTGDTQGVLAASEGEWVESIANTRHGFLSYRAHALIDSGRLDDAKQLIDQLAEWRGTRWLEIWGKLDWLNARLAQARGDLDNARWFYEAAVKPGGFPLPDSLARADYGEFLGQTGDSLAAAQQLSAAAREIEQIGADGYLPEVLARLALIESAPDGKVEGHALDALTERERQVVTHLARGRSNSQIAESLVVSVATVRTHVSNVLRKLQLSSRGEVAKMLRELETE